MRSPPTQHDVAKALGIGQKTVSRAFGAAGYVSDATRTKVLATAEHLGYRPNQGARAMRTGRFGHVVLLQSTEHVVSYLPAGLLSGVHDGLAAAERSLIAARFGDPELSADGFLPQVLRELSADGLLLNYDTAIPPALTRHLRRHRIPAAWLNSRQSADCAHPDDLQAGRLMAEHLLALGHQRITYTDVHLAHTRTCHYSRSDRLTGARAALAEAGLRLNEFLPTAKIPDDNLAGDFTAMLRRERPTALITYSVVEAAAALLAATRLGLVVPRDLSLITVDLEPAFIGIPLTTATSPMAAVGRAAVELLTAKIARPRRELPARPLPYALVDGGSTCPPA